MKKVRKYIKGLLLAVLVMTAVTPAAVMADSQMSWFIPAESNLKKTRLVSAVLENADYEQPVTEAGAKYLLSAIVADGSIEKPAAGGNGNGSEQPPVLTREKAAVLFYQLFGEGAVAVVREDSPSDLAGLTAESQMAIVSLWSTGMMSGYEDGTFRPAETINLAEFMTVFNNLVPNIIEDNNTEFNLLPGNILIVSDNFDISRLPADRTVFLAKSGIALSEALTANQIRNFDLSPKLIPLGLKKDAAVLDNAVPLGSGSGSDRDDSDDDSGSGSINNNGDGNNSNGNNNNGEDTGKKDFIAAETTGITAVAENTYLYFTLKNGSLSEYAFYINGRAVAKNAITAADKGNNIFKIFLSGDSTEIIFKVTKGSEYDELRLVNSAAGHNEEPVQYILGEMVVTASDYTNKQYDTSGMLIYFPETRYSVESSASARAYAPDGISSASLVIPPVDEDGSGNENEYVIRGDFIVDIEMVANAQILEVLGYESDHIARTMERFHALEKLYTIKRNGTSYQVYEYMSDEAADSKVLPDYVKFLLPNGYFGGMLSLNEFLGEQAPALILNNVDYSVNPIQIKLGFTADSDWTENITGICIDDTTVNSVNYEIHEDVIIIHYPIAYYATHKITVLAKGYQAARIDVPIVKSDTAPEIVTKELVEGDNLEIGGIDSTYYSNINLLKVNDRWLSKGTDYTLIGTKIIVSYNARIMKPGENTLAVSFNGAGGYQDWSDTFTVREGTPAEVELGETPELTLVGKAHPKSEAVFAASVENAVWQERITSVKLQSTVEKDISGQVDLTKPGEIKILSTAYLVAGSYTMTVSADGYEDVICSFTVTAVPVTVTDSFNSEGSLTVSSTFNFIYEVKEVLFDDVPVPFSKNGTLLTVSNENFEPETVYMVELVMDQSVNSLYYENVIFEVTTPEAGGPVEVEPPSEELGIELPEDVHLGENAVFTIYNGTAEWKSSITKYQLSKASGSSVYTYQTDFSIDSAVSELTMNHLAVTLAGDYRLTIKAAGYDDVICDFTVLPKKVIYTQDVLPEQLPAEDAAEIPAGEAGAEPEAESGEELPDDVNETDEVETEETETSQVEPDEAETDETETDEAETDGAETDEADANEAETGETETDEAETDETETDETESEESESVEENGAHEANETGSVAEEALTEPEAESEPEMSSEVMPAIG